MLPMILNVAIVVVIVGGLLYLLKLAPIDEAVKRVGTILILIIVIVWALKWLIGVLPH